LKPSLTRATNPERFVAVKYVWVRSHEGGGLGAGPPVAGSQLRSGDGTSRAWRIITNIF